MKNGRGEDAEPISSFRNGGWWQPIEVRITGERECSLGIGRDNELQLNTSILCVHGPSNINI